MVVATCIGEVMQLGSVGGNLEVLFDQYIQKTMKKTASLMAYACQSVTLINIININIILILLILILLILILLILILILLGGCVGTLSRDFMSESVSIWQEHRAGIPSMT